MKKLEISNRIHIRHNKFHEPPGMIKFGPGPQARLKSSDRFTSPQWPCRFPEVKVVLDAARKPLETILLERLSESRFFLIGECHLPWAAPMRAEVTAALPSLQKSGLTTVAFEIAAEKQSLVDNLDFDAADIKKQVFEITKSYWVETLIAAKKLGLKTVFIDSNHDSKQEKYFHSAASNPSAPGGHRGSEDRAPVFRDEAFRQNNRDAFMLTTLSKKLTPEDKVLVAIGSAHVQKACVEKVGYEDDTKIWRLGARLVEKFGNNLVVSFRYCGRNSRFDALLFPDGVTPGDVLPPGEEVFVLPDEG